MKRVLSLLLSLLLLLGCAPARQVARAYIRADKGTWSTHGQTAFGDMVLSYPDPDAVMATLDEALACVGTDGDARELVSVYETQLTAYNELVSATSLAYIRYCQDVTDGQRAAEYGRLNGALYSLQHRLAKLEKALMDRWGYHRERGTAYADSLDKLSRQDADRQRVLRDREDALCRRYEQLEAEFRLEYRGRTWTMAELMQDEDMGLQAFLGALDNRWRRTAALPPMRPANMRPSGERMRRSRPWSRPRPSSRCSCPCTSGCGNGARTIYAT